ncbi:MAG TPA: adenylate/guanylate cyclase domain-containing protein [Methylomirabilota bacterium]|jgi:class 3 adenylate cyclase
MAIRSGLQINAPSAICARCGTPQRATSNFCGECGTRLSAVPALKPARCASRHATVLFCDVVGYTAMSERLDPEDVFALMEQTFGVILDAVHRQSGTVNQFLGDGAMALFDRADAAVAAGLEILERLPAVAAEARRLHGVDFGMRIGVHTGTLAVGAIGVDLRADYTALGTTARVAASLLRIAGRGEMVVTETTRRLIGAPVAFEPHGEIAADDAAEPVACYNVVDDGAVAALGWRYESSDSVEVPDALYA